MQRTLLKSKLHRVRVTHSERDYEGSVTIDGQLLDAAEIREYERIDMYNVQNGERFSTYAMRAAAHKADPGDILIICAYATVGERELAAFTPRLAYVDARNRITHMRDAIPVQVEASRELPLQP